MLSNQAGNSLVILLILAGLITGGVLIEKNIQKNHPPSPAPSAIPQKDQQPTLALTVDQNKQLNELKKADKFTVLVAVSTTEAINLIAAKIQYPKEILKVISVENAAENNPVPLWVSKNDNPEEGYVELVGGIPTPGLLTNGGRTAFAKINFQMLQDARPKKFIINPIGVELYSNKDNKPLSDVVLIPLTSEALTSSEPSPAKPEVKENPKPEAGHHEEQKTQTASLSLDPSIIQSSPGCSFDIALNYDSGGNSFSKINALLTIDPQILTPIQILSAENPPGNLNAPQLTFANDTLGISYLSPANQSYRKKGTLGKITFKVTGQKVEGMTAIKIKYNIGRSDLSDSNILVSPSKDILSEVKNAFVLIKKGSCDQAPSYEILRSK